MSMLAVFAVVLALAGAPANTPISCVHHLASGGLTYWNNTGPSRIEVSDSVCLAARFAGANRQERSAIASSHPMMFDTLGVGLLMLLHEAEHVALQSRNECQVEKAAFAKVPLLLRRFGPRLFPQSMASAKGYHDRLPASYRNC